MAGAPGSWARSGARRAAAGGEWLLQEVGFERVQLLTETGNERLLRAAEAAGFQREGVLHGFLRESESGSTRSCCRSCTVIWHAEAHGVAGQASGGVRTPFDVYVNGVRQELGADYTVSSGVLLFERELVQQKLGRVGVVPRVLGIGTYKRNDDVDVRYEVDGRPAVARLREIRPRTRRPLLTTSLRTHGRSSLSADRIARVAGERLSV